MKNISIIIQKLNFGGAERCASNLSIDLSNLFDTHIIVFDGSNQMYPHGGTLHDLKIPGTSNKIKKVLNVFKRNRAVRKIKKENKIDCSISLLTGANYVNVKSCVGEKTIVSIRNNMSSSSLSDREEKMVRESCRRADCVVALSESVRQDMIANYGVDKDKIVTIYNSCDAERLKRLAAQTDSKNGFHIDGDYIVTMGRLMFQKGQWHLLRAFSEVHKTFPDLKLVILGEGEDEFSEKLKKLSADLGLANSVIFAGYIKNPHNIIAKSKMFVFPSIYEGLGNVLLEALACGKAIISTDCKSGPREILAPDTDFSITEKSKLKDYSLEEYGILIPAFDRSSDLDSTEVSDKEIILANAICKLYEDDQLRAKYENNSEKRIKDFLPEKIACDWKQLIDQICDSELKR